MQQIKEYKKFSSLYTNYKHKVYNYFYYRTAHNSSLAEDLTSDTFVKAYEHFESYDSKFAVSTWIFTIARNTFIDYLRKNENKNVSIDELHEDGTSLDFVEMVDTHLDISHIMKLIATLPQKQQLAITGKYFEYLETKEIAERNGMQESSVRKNLSRGIQRLQELLATFILFFLTL